MQIIIKLFVGTLNDARFNEVSISQIIGTNQGTVPRMCRSQLSKWVSLYKNRHYTWHIPILKELLIFM